MSVYKAKGRRGYVAKFQLRGKMHWVPGGPWRTKRHAQEAELRYRDAVEARRTSETCASFAERWLDDFPGRQDSTRRQYAGAAKRFAKHFGNTPLNDVERTTAHAWALTVPRSVSRVIGTMYADAHNIGLVESNPFAGLRLRATDKTAEVIPPTMAEYEALLNACTILGGYEPEFRAMIQFAAWTGVRQGELFGLYWEDVDGDQLHVRRARKVDGSLGKPKGGKERTIPLLPPAQVLDAVPRRPDPFVFHTVRGQSLRRGTHAWTWNKVRAAAGVDVQTCAGIRSGTFVRRNCSSSASITSRSASSSGTRTAASS
jgi:integrase